MSASNKVRLDQLLVSRGFAQSRTKAQALIMSGQVKVDGKLSTKSGTLIWKNSELEVLEGAKYVSRAGLKLESVAPEFKLDFRGKIVLDVGSSTGGFTDYALQHGAAKVYAVDVGRGQLAHKLRHDDRVVPMEQTDIRSAELPEKADLITIDVSFISLRKVLPSTINHLKSDGVIVALAKPQFEATKAVADRYKGVVTDPEVRAEILSQLEAWFTQHFEIVAAADSKVAGAAGNLERFYLLSL